MHILPVSVLYRSIGALNWLRSGGKNDWLRSVPRGEATRCICGRMAGCRAGRVALLLTPCCVAVVVKTGTLNVQATLKHVLTHLTGARTKPNSEGLIRHHNSLSVRQTQCACRDPILGIENLADARLDRQFTIYDEDDVVKMLADVYMSYKQTPKSGARSAAAEYASLISHVKNRLPTVRLLLLNLLLFHDFMAG